ncbi:MAG: ATP-binding cassette domain-containing protein [Elusimicrobia bacterium]|nr:ATP-binding cassette domain-containing protein [Elusimicrobiota bacterium]
MIEVKDLVKYYGTEQALSGISFSISRGEVVGFLGPNGAGKTTTLRILTGYLTPTSGQVNIFDYTLEKNPIEIKKRIGYLPESNPLYYEMNVLDYLTFIAQLRGIEKNNIKKRLSEVVQICGVKDVLKKNISDLSKGYKQRVGIAQAMIHNPDILIMDEPTSGLDPNQIIEIRDLIRRLGKEKTVILSTHVLSEVQATCDRVIIINKGKIAADGKTTEIDKFVAGNEELVVQFKGKIENVSGIFSDLPGVVELNIKNMTDMLTEIEIVSKQGDDLREKVFNRAVERRLVILEQTRTILSLEDVFRMLTQDGSNQPRVDKN